MVRWEKSAGWVKGKAVGVWSGGKKRWSGQRESHRSVAWWEKAMVGSKGKLWECGLTRKNAAWVKEEATEVWSDKKKRRLGQRESCGSVAWQGKTAAWVKEEATGVWPGKGKPPPGSKKKSPECGLERKTAAWVKEKVAGVWSGKKNCRLGQRERHRSVV